MTCPTREQLEVWLSGELHDADADELARHVDDCSHCQSVLDQFGQSVSSSERETNSATLESADRVAVERLVHEMRQQSEPATLQTSRSSEATHSATTFELPQRVGNYELQEFIGEGATGQLFRAIDITLGRTVAIKLLKPQYLKGSDTWQRFVREARAAAALKSDHVVTVFDVDEGSAGHSALLAIEFVAGGSLAKRIRSVPLRTGVEWVLQTARGLAAAHAAGIVHRDIKPSNLLLDEAAERVKIADFGLARLEDASEQLTATGMLAGTPSYMSPEQINDPSSADALSDLYSLGVVLYEVLTHELPFRGSTRRILEQVLHTDPAAPRLLNDEVSRDIETVCLKAMSKERSLRYGSATEFADDLERWLAGLPVIARPIGPLRRALRWTRRNPLLAGGAFIVALVLAGGFVDWVQFLQHPEATRSKLVEARPPLRSGNVSSVQQTSNDRANYLRLVAEIAGQTRGTPEQHAANARLLSAALISIEQWIGHDDDLPVTPTTAEDCSRIGAAALQIGRAPLARRCLRRAEQLARVCVEREPSEATQRILLQCLINLSDAETECLELERATAFLLESAERAESLLKHALEARSVEHDAQTSETLLRDAHQLAARDWSNVVARLLNRGARGSESEKTVAETIAQLRKQLASNSNDRELERVLAMIEATFAATARELSRDAATEMMQSALARFDRLIEVDADSPQLLSDAAQATELAVRKSLLPVHPQDPFIEQQALLKAQQLRTAAIALNPTNVRFRQSLADLLRLIIEREQKRAGQSPARDDLRKQAIEQFEVCGADCWRSRHQQAELELERAISLSRERMALQAKDALRRALQIVDELHQAVHSDAAASPAAAEKVSQLGQHCRDVQRFLDGAAAR